MSTRKGRVAFCVYVVALLLAGSVLVRGQSGDSRADTPQVARNQAGPTFTVPENDLHTPVKIISYGDMRFTDPSNVTATNPTARQALVARIAAEKPDAVLLNGDVPWHGGDKNDYATYRMETGPWRDARLRIYPALGNHEFSQCEVQQCLENWWDTFLELKGLRWYSALLGTKLYAISLDSNDSLLPGSDQYQWLQAQMASLPRNVKFAIITMHHPPVADFQTRLHVDHNPRPNEIALAELLSHVAATSSAGFLVLSGHIHNYERSVQDSVTYLVSGGGGAEPYEVERTPSDLYQDTSFPNYHYVELVLAGDTLQGTMYKLSDPSTAAWEVKDAFEIHAK